MKLSIRFQVQVSENGGRSARDADESFQAATRSSTASDSRRHRRRLGGQRGWIDLNDGKMQDI